MPKPATVIESKVEPNPALEKRTRRVFTADYKLSILQQADTCQHGELGDLLRREKLYSNQLAQCVVSLPIKGLQVWPSPRLAPPPRKIPIISVLPNWRKKTSDCVSRLP